MPHAPYVHAPDKRSDTPCDAACNRSHAEPLQCVSGDAPDGQVAGCAAHAAQLHALVPFRDSSGSHFPLHGSQPAQLSTTLGWSIPPRSCLSSSSTHRIPSGCTPQGSGWRATQLAFSKTDQLNSAFLKGGIFSASTPSPAQNSSFGMFLEMMQQALGGVVCLQQKSFVRAPARSPGMRTCAQLRSRVGHTLVPPSAARRGLK